MMKNTMIPKVGGEGSVCDLVKSLSKETKLVDNWASKGVEVMSYNPGKIALYVSVDNIHPTDAMSSREHMHYLICDINQSLRNQGYDVSSSNIVNQNEIYLKYTQSKVPSNYDLAA